MNAVLYYRGSRVGGLKGHRTEKLKETLKFVEKGSHVLTVG